MDKETKERLKRALTMTDDKQLLKFAKSYANKNQAFAEAIIEKFLPEEDKVDYEKMVMDCFLHHKRGGTRRYGSSLDWTVIRREIKRVLKQFDYLRKHQDSDTAVDGAMMMLETLADEFIRDRVYEDYNYGNSNFGDEQALTIIKDVLLNDEQMPREKKIGIIKRLQVLAKRDVYRSYLESNFDEVIDNLNQSLLSPEELLLQLDNNIQAARYDSDKSYYVKWKINLLDELGRNDEAEKVISQYLDLEDISTLRYDMLLAASRYDEAKAFCKERLSKGGRRNEPRIWHKRLVGLGQQTGDKETIRRSARWLFLNDNVQNDSKKEYYHIFKATFEEKEWPTHRDKLFIDYESGKYDTKLLFKIYEEEKLYSRLFSALIRITDDQGFSYFDHYSNSGGKRLVFFSQYAKFFTEKQCAEMVKAISKIIQFDAQRANTRGSYASVADGLHLLSISCEKGRQTAKQIAEKILRDNPLKPAFKEEINRYKF